MRYSFSLPFISLSFISVLLNINLVFASDYKVELLSADNGFISSVIFSIVQDEQGFLWFGSGHQGLFRYDGKNIKRFKHDSNNTNSLPHNNAGNLSIDNDKNLWVGSWGGGAIKYNFDSASFSQYTHNPLNSNTLNDTHIQSIFQDNQGDYWIGSFLNGLTKFNSNNQSFTPFPFGVENGEGTSNERIWDIIETDQNNLWLATSYGLNKLNKETGKFSYYIPNPKKVVEASNKIRKILPTPDNGLLLATDNGVLVFDMNNKTFTRIPEELNHEIGVAYSIIKTSFDKYWVASESGVFSFSLDSLKLEKVNLGIKDDCSQTLFEDSEGYIWLTCEGVGIYKINQNKYFKLKNTPYFRTTSFIRNASENSIYLLSPTLGIREWFPETDTLNTPFPAANILRPDRLLSSIDGEIWLRGQEKLFSIKKSGEVTLIASSDKLQGSGLTKHITHFFSVEKDKFSRIWLGTGQGLYIIDNDKNQLFRFGNNSSNANSFKHQHINHIFRDQADKMWVATQEGLYLWDEKTNNFNQAKFNKSKKVNFLTDVYFNVTYQDKNKNIWLGSRSGLYSVNENTMEITPSIINKDLPGKNITSIVEDSDNNLWLMTDSGLTRFNAKTLSVDNFDQRDGLSDSRSYGRFATTSDGTIYLSSREGLHYFNPKLLKKKVNKAKTILTNFEVLGSPTEKIIHIKDSSSYNLAYDENYLKFEFATITQANARQVNYYYKLEGFDESWINNENNNTAIYTNLVGGEYTFKVRSTYRENEWYEPELVVKFKIATPFWKTWWMYTIYALLFILLIQQYMRRKNRKQQKIIEQQKNFVVELEQQVAEKTASIAKESDKLAQANEIKSQFLANMSHEIRTPLNAVIGLSNIALSNETNKNQADYLRKIQDSSESLLSLVNGILDLSKIEAKKLTLEYLPFNLDLLITKIVNICSYKAHEKDLELIIDIADDVNKELIGDQLRLQQVLINLMNNAIKFTDRGLIFLSVESVFTDKKFTTLQFSITDTGIGMDLSEQENLFDAFSQADDSITKKYGGTGLGLTISKQLIELMNGKIFVRSQLTKGSVFTFTAKFYSSDNKNYSNDSVQEIHIKQLKTLVIDSNGIVGDIITRVLGQISILPDYAENFENALNKIVLAEKSNTPYELVIIDWKLYQHDEDINNHTQQKMKITNLPHIFIGNYFDKDKCTASKNNHQFLGFIEKPIIPSTFIQSVNEMLTSNIDNTVVDTIKTETPQFERYSLLLVEDNMLNQLVAKTFLEDTNIQIDCAEDGEIAIDKIKNKTYDIILMDIQMPNMDGLTATSMIRNELKLTEVPIIAMTAHAMEEDAQKSKLFGINEHLTKPISAEKLYSMLLKYLS